MRISIRHREATTGLIVKRPIFEVEVQVFFTELETQIIEQRNLQSHVIMERVPAIARTDDDPAWFYLRIGKLLSGAIDVFPCSSPSAAKRYERDLRAQLITFKEFIDDNETLGDDETYEL